MSDTVNITRHAYNVNGRDCYLFIRCQLSGKTWFHRYYVSDSPEYSVWDSAGNSEPAAVQEYRERIEAKETERLAALQKRLDAIAEEAKAKQPEPSKGMVVMTLDGVLAITDADRIGANVMCRLSYRSAGGWKNYPSAKANAALFVNAEATARERDQLAADNAEWMEENERMLAVIRRRVAWATGNFASGERGTTISVDERAILADHGGAT